MYNITDLDSQKKQIQQSMQELSEKLIWLNGYEAALKELDIATTPEKPRRAFPVGWTRYWKLTKEMAAEIKWLCHNTKLKNHEIAERYPITAGMVSKIRTNCSHRRVSPSKPSYI